MTDSPIDRYFGHAAAAGVALPASTRISMSGRIRVGPWLRFEAEWEGDGSSFSWKAFAGPGRLRPLRVHDQFAEGEGSMDVRLRPNIKLIHADGDDVRRSGAARAAIEAIWAPGSLLPERGVTWQVASDRLIVATREVAPEVVQLNIEIDSSGAVTACHGQRWRDAKHGYQPFGAEVHAERTFDGITIPSELTVGWGFGTEEWWPFFECEVLTLNSVA